MDAFPLLGDAERLAPAADVLFGDAGDFGQVAVGEAVFLGIFEEVIGNGARTGSGDDGL